MAPGDFFYTPYTPFVSIGCAFKSMLASERVHVGVQLHASRPQLAKVWGLALRGREFLQI